MCDVIEQIRLYIMSAGFFWIVLLFNRSSLIMHGLFLFYKYHKHLEERTEEERNQTEKAVNSINRWRIVSIYVICSIIILLTLTEYIIWYGFS